MQCSVTVVNLIHDTATETDRPVCHAIPGSSWREKLDTSGGDPQRTVHICCTVAAVSDNREPLLPHFHVEGS